MLQSCQNRFSRELVHVNIAHCMRPSNLPRTSRPSKASGIAFACTGVGSANFSLVIACNNRASRPKSVKVTAGEAEAMGESWVITSSGTSFSFNFRFILR